VRAKAKALAVVAALLMAVSLAAAYADVIYLYTARVTLAPVQNPVSFLSYYNSTCSFVPNISVTKSSYGSSQSSRGYAFTLYNKTPSGTPYYLVRWPFSVINSSSQGSFTVSLNKSGAVVLRNDSTNVYMAYQNLSAPVASKTYYVGNLTFSPSPGLEYIYVNKVTVTLVPPPWDVLSLVDNQSYQVSVLVYQGDFNGQPVKNVITSPPTPVYWWPADISGVVAQTYWSYWYPNAAYQPTMNMTGYFYDMAHYASSPKPTAGAFLWTNGTNPNQAGYRTTMVAIATYSNASLTSGNVGHGIDLYFFVIPSKWSVSTSYNQSIAYKSSVNVTTKPSPVMGDVIFPVSPDGSKGEYFVVQWDPAWAYNYAKYKGATGPWNVWVVQFGAGGAKISFYPTTSPNLGSPYAGWDGIGGWSPYPWVPSAGDYVLICVTWFQNNTLVGFAEDLNKPWLTSWFKLNLGSNYKMPGMPPPGPPPTPPPPTPPSGFAYGVGAGTGSSYSADWSVVYTYLWISKNPPPSP
jgi:hypothetical protein